VSPPASPVPRRRGTARVYGGSRRKEKTVFLAARIPKSLHRRLQVHCVEHEVEIQQFVEDAVREWLGKQSRKGRPR